MIRLALNDVVVVVDKICCACLLFRKFQVSRLSVILLNITVLCVVEKHVLILIEVGLIIHYHLRQCWSGEP